MKNYVQSIVLGIVLYAAGYSTIFFYQYASNGYISTLISMLNSGFSFAGVGAVVVGIYLYFKQKA
jgi:hypothetical protein